MPRTGDTGDATSTTFTGRLLARVQARLTPCSECGKPRRTQREVADELGIGVSTLVGWLKGKSIPGGRDLDTVAERLDAIDRAALAARAAEEG